MGSISLKGGTKFGFFEDRFWFLISQGFQKYTLKMFSSKEFAWTFFWEHCASPLAPLNKAAK